MGTVLRVDTPKQLRDLDAQLGRPSVVGRIVVSLIFAAASPIVLVFAVLVLDPIGVLVSIGWFALWTGWIFRLQHKLKAARPYRVPVLAGLDEIRQAHDIYRRFSPDSSSREYALPLVEAMYRISVVPVKGQLGERRLVGLMRERVAALRNLLDAEDRVALASAGQWADDRDDLGVVQAYQEALVEVEAKLRYEI